MLQGPENWVAEEEEEGDTPLAATVTGHGHRGIELARLRERAISCAHTHVALQEGPTH